jgi:AraC-like DNA-binding protein
METIGTTANARRTWVPTGWNPAGVDPSAPQASGNAVAGGYDSVSRALAEVLMRMRFPASTDSSGLSPWQIIRVFAHIAAHFDRVIRTEELATLAHVSPFHFCRVFHRSFGAPPHRYITLIRVECAKLLIRDTSASLGQIAAECGMADQAHLNKLFRRFVGTSPGAWRRAEHGLPHDVAHESMNLRSP